MLSRARRALSVLLFDPKYVPVELKGMNFYVDPTDDPFIPVGGVLLVKGVSETRGVYYREYHTRDLSLMERYGMLRSASDTASNVLTANDRPRG